VSLGPAALVRSLPAALGRTPAEELVLVGVSGLSLLDAITVANGRWRSYECDNPSCCPPEGNPITEGPTP
jgi:hypothetical protein